MSRNLKDIFTISLESIALADLERSIPRVASARGARLVEARALLSEAAWGLRTAKGKYDHIDFKPPESAANAAKRGLEYRRKQKGDKAGLSNEEASEQGIGSGVQRAVNLKNRDTMSPATVKRMHNFFSRHEKNKSIDAKHKGTPWKDNGYVSWLLWGGDPGAAWARKVVKQMEAADEKAKKKASVRSVFRTASDNEPTDPKLWSRAIAEAKKKFDKYPCVPVEGSFALTRAGWKSFFELNVSDEIVSYNRDIDRLEWSPVRRLHHHREAPLVRLFKAATCFDFTCTPDHKWVLRNKPRTGSSDRKTRAYKYPDQLVSASQITTNMDLITSARMRDDHSPPVALTGFRKSDWSWVEKVLAMSNEQREAWLASAVVYDGHENGFSERYARCSYGFSQKNPDHAAATEIAAALLGYNVSFRAKAHNPEMMSYTFIDRQTHGTQNIVREELGTGEVWCPETDNSTWLMKQGRMVTITGNSAYANGWAVKWYNDKGGGWRKKD